VSINARGYNSCRLVFEVYDHHSASGWDRHPERLIRTRRPRRSASRNPESIHYLDFPVMRNPTRGWSATSLWRGVRSSLELGIKVF
jgi:hypothetical protein